ncbi:MAG: apolipoprotein N-acyltransferase, partial [Gluconacetobacter diazotrophicus]|nr:apolipoprotein N-acyltransferase [Gluconacetobacter diazotrophicus]
WKRAGWLGFCFGMGLHVAGLYWVTAAVLVRASELWWAVPLAVPVLAVPLALFVAAACAVARLAPAGSARVAVLAASWTAFDMARQFAFTGFPWNPLGSVWAFPGQLGEAMIQPAAWVSVHGLTLATVWLAGLPSVGWRRGWLPGAALLLFWLGAGEARLRFGPVPGPPGPVAVLVQGNVPEEEKQDPERARGIFWRYVRLTADGVATARRDAGTGGGAARPVVFVWPESAFPGLLTADERARQVLMQAAPGAAYGLVGSVRFADNSQRPRNSLVALAPDGTVAATYDKAHLVPFGEYQPAGLPFQVVPGGGFAAGPGVRTLHLPGLPPVGPLICYEVIFPGQVAEAGDRPAWLVNVTNDAWYGNTAGPRQHLVATRFRAVEEGLPLVRAANTGISAGFDAYGHPLGRLGWGRAGALVVAVPGALPPTLFARLGLWMPAALCLLLGGTGMALRRRRHPDIETNLK